ncbi:MAG: acetyltransferase [Flavobacteriales bacterium]|nr:acetyltransferase [Flavobacteriales bacterium]
MSKNVIVIGYSGHAYVAIDTLISQGRNVIGYADLVEKEDNPFNLDFLGNEDDENVLSKLQDHDFFISMSNNKIRRHIYRKLDNAHGSLCNAIHESSVVSSSAELATGVMVSSNAVINALSSIGVGSICNTSSIVEHNCVVGDFSHVGPNATLCGSVRIGNGTFIGANSVIKEGVSIGNNVTIGAGTVVLKNIPDNVTVVGNPSHIIQK